VAGFVFLETRALTGLALVFCFDFDVVFNFSPPNEHVIPIAASRFRRNLRSVLLSGLLCDNELTTYATERPREILKNFRD